MIRIALSNGAPIGVNPAPIAPKAICRNVVGKARIPLADIVFSYKGGDHIDPSIKLL